MSEMYIPRAIPFNAPCFTGLNHSEIADFVGLHKLHTEMIGDEEKLFLVGDGIRIISIYISIGDFLVKNHDGSISVHSPESFYALYQECTNV